MREERAVVGIGEGRGGEGQESRDKASLNWELRIRELSRERKVDGEREAGEERRWERRGSGTGRFRGRNEMEGRGTVWGLEFGLESAAVRRRSERGEGEVEKRRRFRRWAARRAP